jgi:hypothetical protein
MESLLKKAYLLIAILLFVPVFVIVPDYPALLNGVLLCYCVRRCTLHPLL